VSLWLQRERSVTPFVAEQAWDYDHSELMFRTMVELGVRALSFLLQSR
jgi:hypothetical protein